MRIIELCGGPLDGALIHDARSDDDGTMVELSWPHPRGVACYRESRPARSYATVEAGALTKKVCFDYAGECSHVRKPR